MKVKVKCDECKKEFKITAYKMREIKFRAWDKIDKTMYENAINNCKDTFDMVLKHPQIYEVMQYTGLKDKNGVEIYEGDIIHWKADAHNKYIGNFKIEADVIVEWNEKELKWIAREKGASVFDELKDLAGYDFEIIGNIHENKELLEG